MIEDGIDVTYEFPKGLDHFKGLDVDIVVKIFEQDVDLSSLFPGTEFVHYKFRNLFVEGESDEESHKQIVKTKDRIRRWIKTKFGNQKDSNKIYEVGF